MNPAYPPQNPIYPPTNPTMMPSPQWNGPPPGQYPPGPAVPMVLLISMWQKKREFGDLKPFPVVEHCGTRLWLRWHVLQRMSRVSQYCPSFLPVLQHSIHPHSAVPTHASTEHGNGHHKPIKHPQHCPADVDGHERSPLNQCFWPIPAYCPHPPINSCAPPQCQI